MDIAVSLRARIIPADAGSTEANWASGFNFTGSSPRMRGARSRVFRIRVFRGIIPADAGSTRRCLSRCLHQRDHPRGCGEHSMVSVTPGWVSGSSPRMRGARNLLLFCPFLPGIIPADAGSTRAMYHPVHRC